jgi:hypothetical protein
MATRVLKLYLVCIYGYRTDKAVNFDIFFFIFKFYIKPQKIIYIFQPCNFAAPPSAPHLFLLNPGGCPGTIQVRSGILIWAPGRVGFRRAPNFRLSALL